MNHRSFTPIAFAVVVVLAGAGNAGAQVVTASDTITVSAQNVGLFVFTIAEATFDFGNVNADCTASSTVPCAVSGANGVYTATTAANWNCRSAPQRTVRIFQDASGSSHTGGMAEAQVEAQVPTGTLVCPLCSGAQASAGFVAFSTASDADLITGLQVRNGPNDVDGTIDFRLTVEDSDPLGANSWVVQLTAEGT